MELRFWAAQELGAAPCAPRHLLLPGGSVGPGGFILPSPGTNTNTGTGMSGSRALSRVPSQQMVLTPRCCRPRGYGMLPGLTPVAGGEGQRSVRSSPQPPRPPRAPAAPTHGTGLCGTRRAGGLRAPGFMGRDDLVP